MVGDRPAGLDRAAPGSARGSAPPRALDGAGEAADQPGRVDRGAVRGEGRRRACRWRPSRARAASGVEQPQVVLAAAPGAGGRDLVAGPAPAAAGVRASASVPPLWAWASMPSVGGDGEHLVDGGAHRLVLGERAPSRPSRAARPVVASTAGNSAEHQPPLRPEAPKPAVSASSTTTRSVGSAAQQVVGGPQPGVARRRRRRRRRRCRPASGGPRRPVVVGGLVPQGEAGRRGRRVAGQRTPHE